MFAKKVKLDSPNILPLVMLALEPGPIIAHPFTQISSFTLFCFMYLNTYIVYNVDVNVVDADWLIDARKTLSREKKIHSTIGLFDLKSRLFFKKPCSWL